MFDLGKMLGVNIDPKKVNEVVQFLLESSDSIKTSLAGIDNKLGDLVELKKEEIKLLKGVKK